MHSREHMHNVRCRMHTFHRETSYHHSFDSANINKSIAPVKKRKRKRKRKQYSKRDRKIKVIRT